MNNINYFFDLFDDNGTGQVDREGILRISEALLFLSWRGFDGTITPSQPLEEPNGGFEGEHIEKDKLSTDERFLGSVSSFIRRCFEYADPTRPEYQNTVEVSTREATDRLDSFSIGDDDDEDLIDVDGDSKAKSTEEQNKTSTEPDRRISESANPALDPNNPLHITLPTFRMVILADELLEQFFDSFFPQSFRLSDHPLPAPATSLSSNLTTFSNLGKPSQLNTGVPTAGASGGIVPPGKGLRGVLDNIVTDGIRMAAEVKKKMDEAQRDLERNALSREEDDEDEDDDYDHRPVTSTAPTMVGGISSWGAGAYGADPERRSVRDKDRDLLEGAEVVSVRGKDETQHAEKEGSEPNNQMTQPSQQRSDSGHSPDHDNGVVSKVVEFDS